MDAGRFTEQSKGLIGEVKVTTVSLVRGNDGQITEKLESAAIYRYDRAGNLIESIGEMPEKPASRTIWKYDSENRPRETAFFYDGAPLGRTEFLYDSAGRLIEKRFYGGDGGGGGGETLQNAIRSVYTPEGFRVEDEILPVFDGDTEVIHCVEIPNLPDYNNGGGVSFCASRVRRLRKICDPQGNTLEISLFRERNKQAGKIFVAYDENKRATAVAQYGLNEMFLCEQPTRWQRLLSPVILRLFDFYLRLKTIYRCAAGREFQKARRCLRFGALYHETRFFYNDAGQLTHDEDFFAGDLICQRRYVYDDRGNKIEEITNWNDIPVAPRERHEYEYDSRGNWVKKTTLYRLPSNGREQTREFTSVVYRAIKYRSDAPKVGGD